MRYHTITPRPRKFRALSRDKASEKDGTRGDSVCEYSTLDFAVSFSINVLLLLVPPQEQWQAVYPKMDAMLLTSQTCISTIEQFQGVLTA
jgi:hypothetical protein